ncbi:MAG: 30S ribosome-binding factor RbfA [Anaerolineae bacterium]|nr:30S ribosome-binding factor RbfA [Anaerolineae bacterium]
MSEPSVRQRRVADLVARELSVILQQRARDPRLHAVVITGVRVSGDLRQATVFVSSVTPEDRGMLVEALVGSEPFLRRELAERVHLRYVPTLSFHLDETFDRASRIESLLDQVARDSEESGDVAQAD